MSGQTILTYEELIKHKHSYTTLPEPVAEYARTLVYHKPKQSGWRRQDSKQAPNWMAQIKNSQNQDEKLYSSFRSILNKLSASNFNQLAEEIINLQITQKHHLERLVELLFQKAITELKYNEIYAKLSRELSTYYIETPQENTSIKIYFRELLINKCQYMFTQAISLDKEIDAPEQVTQEATPSFKYKEQVLGCMAFVGQLYQYDLLTSKIIHSCFTLLFAKAKLKKAYVIDNICVLLLQVGEKFSNKSPLEFSDCYSKLEKLLSEVTQVRDKFTILDVLDKAKQNKWLSK